MEMDYKLRLGAELMRRAEFVQCIHHTRVEHNNIKLQCDRKRNARELIDWDRDNVLRSEFACNTSSRTSSTVTKASLQETKLNEVNQSNSIVKHSKKRSHDEDDREEAKKPASKP